MGEMVLKRMSDMKFIFKSEGNLMISDFSSAFQVTFRVEFGAHNDTSLSVKK
jgi:hypothetical protein